MFPAPDLLEGFDLSQGRGRINVLPRNSVPFMNGFGPPVAHGICYAIEPCFAKHPLANVMPHERLTISRGWISVEVARASVRTIAGLDHFASIFHFVGNRSLLSVEGQRHSAYNRIFETPSIRIVYGSRNRGFC